MDSFFIIIMLILQSETFFFFFKYLFSFCFYFLEKIEFRIIFITVLPGVIFGNLSKRFFIEFRNWQLGLR